MNDLKYLGSCKYNENSSSEPKSVHSFGIDKKVYGFPFDRGNKEYTVLLVGATKCGKSTLIDFIANFFMGISSPKNGVINVTRNNKEKDEFLFYTFCTNDNTVFTFIDSPSINNENGFVDKKRKQIFLNYIKEMKQKGIKISAIGFVIQNHFVSLPPAEEGTLKFVTGLLKEKDIGHIIPFITYADANTPPVIDALHQLRINTDKYLVFNNVCLNSTIKQISKLNELYWETGLENIQKGLDIVRKLQPIDLLGSIEDIGFENRKGNEDLKYLGSCKYNENTSPKPKILHSFGIEKHVYGFPFDKSNRKYTVLLVGATKCGKSTLIDFIANFFLGISSPKNEVIYVTRNNIDKDAFYFYTFCANDNTDFTFIDSPSINNEKGFVDKSRKQIFMKNIKEMKKNGIKINAIGVVIQNHFVRLPPAEEGMLRFVTGLLEERDIGRIIPFITYADANTPPVIDALRAFRINTDKCLHFNNICLNPSIKQISKLNELYWETGLENIQKGLDVVMKLKPIELPGIHQEDIEQLNENSKDIIDGYRGGSKGKFNTFAGRRPASQHKERSKNLFGSMRSKGSMRKKKTSEVTKEISDIETQDHLRQRAASSQPRKGTSRSNKGCNIL